MRSLQIYGPLKMDAYLAIIYHFVDESNHEMATVLHGVGHFPEARTAQNVSGV